MAVSKLPLTGKCHNCGKPTDKRFCCHNCNNQYLYWLKAGQRQRWTAKPLTQKQIDANIERVVQKAIARGTCYAVAQLAPEH